MKLKYTTKVFIVVNAIIIAFRTIQIMLLTESGNCFLKDGFKAVNIIGTVVSVLALAALFINSSQAVRQPEKINCKGVPSAVAAVLSGILYLSGGVIAVLGRHYGGTLLLIVSLSATVACVMMAISALKAKPIPKIGALGFAAFWLAEFVLAYFFYTERALRVRTVYEAFAVCFVILFSITFGKAISGVSSEKNFRRIYPLGLTSCSLCMVSLVPELIAGVCGFGDRVTESAVMPVTLAAAAVFTGFFTINTFKKSNTIHPKAKKYRDNISG